MDDEALSRYKGMMGITDDWKAVVNLLLPVLFADDYGENDENEGEE